MSTVISIEDVSKLYRLGEIGTGSLAHDVNRWWHKVRGSEDPYLQVGVANDRTTKADSDYVYAVKDVSFEVKQGEALGIIGRNGAGKSTLLKILSRVTTPTKGQIKVKGRIASLLEVGTGFHPELSGRENIYLNGAILGMRKAEIRSKFDEIVEFSGCERYIDTPVKRYSSGMYVRLAFAVAAHLEPEILIVDEVLAVGDAEFQKKCLGKMKDVAGQGRTVIFVSHQIASVTRLCENVIWMDKGTVKQTGASDWVCSQYLANGSRASHCRVWDHSSGHSKSGFVKLNRLYVAADELEQSTVPITSEVRIQVEYTILKGGRKLIPNVHFYSEDGTLIFISHDWSEEWRNTPKEQGKYCTSFIIPGNFFSEGRITVNIAMSTYNPFEVHFVEEDAIAFMVTEVTNAETSRGDFSGPLPGIVRPLIPSVTSLIRN